MREQFSEEIEKTFKASLLMQSIFTFAFINSIFICGFVLWQKISGREADIVPPEDASGLAFFLYPVAILSVVSSVYVRQWIASKAKKVLRSDFTAESFRVLTGPYLVGLVIALALCEAASVCGLALSLEARAWNHYIILSIIALAGIAFHFPKPAQFRLWIESKILD